MLRRDGFEVGTAGSAAEAVQMIGDGARPDVLVTEFIFPDTDGVELANDIRFTMPNLAVLILTTGALPLPQTLARDRISVLEKPFTTASLSNAVFALVGGPAEGKRPAHKAACTTQV